MLFVKLSPGGFEWWQCELCDELVLVDATDDRDQDFDLEHKCNNVSAVNVSLPRNLITVL